MVLYFCIQRGHSEWADNSLVELWTLHCTTRRLSVERILHGRDSIQLGTGALECSWGQGRACRRGEMCWPKWFNEVGKPGEKNMENSLPCRKCILVVDLAHFHSSYMCARRKNYASKTPPYAFPTCTFSSFRTTTRAKRLNLWKTPSQLCNQLWI